MRTRQITVPKDKEAESALDYDIATPQQLLELKLTNEEFEKFWKEGIFSLINQVGNINIDDFEDEHITDLNIIENVLYELNRNRNSSTEIIKMFELALEYKTSIHFYF